MLLPLGSRRAPRIGADEAVLEQLSDPGAVLHVGLAAGNLGDLGRVGEDTAERLQVRGCAPQSAGDGETPPARPAPWRPNDPCDKRHGSTSEHPAKPSPARQGR